MSHRAEFVSVLLAAALVSGSAAAAQEPPTLTLTLQDALALAAKNSFDVQVEKLVFDQAEWRLKAAEGAYDLNLSANWGASVSRTPTTSVLQAGGGRSLYLQRQDTYGLGLEQYTPWGQDFTLSWNNTRTRTNSAYSLFNPSYGSTLQLGTTLPLLRGLGKVADLSRRKARLDREAAGFQYAQSLRDTLLQVEQSYWDLVYALRSLEVSRSGLQLAKEFQTETAARIRAGVLAPIEQVTADAQVAQREQDIVVAESQARNTEDVLKLALGYAQEGAGWNQHVVPSEEPSRNPGAYDESSLLQKAEALRPEIRVLQRTLDKNRLDTAWAKNQILPSLTLSGSLTYAGTAGDYYNSFTGAFVNSGFSDAWNQVTGRDYKSWALGLALRYPLQNRGARYTFQTYRLAQSATEIQLEKTRQIVANDVRLSLRNLQTTEKRIAAADLNVRLQQQKLDAEKKKYENGLSTSFNVLSYQNDLIAAKSALLKARIDNQLAQASLDRAVGTYLEGKGLRVAETAAAAAGQPSADDSRLPAAGK